MSIATTCPTCEGRGTYISNPCTNCNGTGRAPFSRTVNAVVPAGVDNGMRLRLGGEGEHPETGGEPGDLYVFIHVEPDENIEREGDDLYCRVHVSYIQAILGCKLTVPVIDESVTVFIEAGTQPGDEVRISGKGAPRVGKRSFGDLVVQVHVDLPKKLSEKEKALLVELSELESERIEKTA